MDFLNENFKTIEDLKKIDNIINGLNKEREDIEKTILNGDDDHKRDGTYEKIQLQSAEISENLNTLLNTYLNEKLSIQQCRNEVSLLVSTYGELQLFEDVYDKLNELEQMRSDRDVVKRFKTIYDDLNNWDPSELSPLTILDELKQITGKIDDFKKTVPDTSLTKQIINTIDSRLSNVITEDLKPIFSKTPSVDNLRQLLVLQSLDPINSSVRPFWCLQFLIKDNFELKFKYHYDSNVETNTLDKPEWFLKFVQDWILKNLDPLNNEYSRILQNTIYERESFKLEYISTLMELVKYKIKKNLDLISRISDEKVLSNLLMHMIEEMLKNDDFFVNNFKIHINLIDQMILSDEDITYRWLEFEKDFNFTKYDKIISTRDSFQIDFESVASGITKPTNSSILCKNLLNNLNVKYTLIKNLNFKLRLLSQIQLKILESYYERLEELLDAFNNLFRKFKLLKHRSEDEELINGVKGMDRLLRIYCSLQYIIELMEEWNESLLFIQLSHLIKEDNFFKTLIDSYQELLYKVTNVIDEFMNREINTSLKLYFKLSNWSNLESYEGVMTLELKNGVNQLSSLTNYLKRTLSEIDVLPILQNFEEKLIKFFNESILNLNTFNTYGSKQLLLDYQQAIEMLQLYPNLQNYLKYDEILRYLTVVDMNLVEKLYGRYANPDLYSQVCEQNKFEYLKQDTQMMARIAKRKIL